MKQALTVILLFVSAAAFAQNSGESPQPDGPLTLMSVETRAPSTYLADGNGYALYALVESGGPGGERTVAPEDATGDTGDGSRMKALPCNADCREAWPPLTVDSADAKIETRGLVDASLIGTTQLDDGSTQVTYNGYPLYYFRRDLNKSTGAGGSVSGQSVEAFGGVWYVLDPDTGEPVVSDTETASGS